jgi:hypothetical protein
MTVQSFQWLSEYGFVNGQFIEQLASMVSYTFYCRIRALGCKQLNFGVELYWQTRSGWANIRTLCKFHGSKRLPLRMNCTTEYN